MQIQLKRPLLIKFNLKEGIGVNFRTMTIVVNVTVHVDYVNKFKGYHIDPIEMNQR